MTKAKFAKAMVETFKVLVLMAAMVVAALAIAGCSASGGYASSNGSGLIWRTTFLQKSEIADFKAQQAGPTTRSIEFGRAKSAVDADVAVKVIEALK